MNAPTKNIIGVDGATAEFEYDGNTISSVTLHQSIGLSRQAHRLIRELMDEQFSGDYRLIQESYGLNGRVHIVKWKVIYE